MFIYILVHVMYIHVVEAVLGVKPSNIVSPWFPETRVHYVYPGLLWTALAVQL